MKPVYLFAFLILMNSGIRAQTSAVQGKVTDSTGQAIAIVVIKQFQIKVLTTTIA